MCPLLDTSFSLIPQEHRNMNCTPMLSHPEARELALCPAAGHQPWAAEDKDQYRLPTQVRQVWPLGNGIFPKHGGTVRHQQHPHRNGCGCTSPIRGSGWGPNSIPYNFQIAYLPLSLKWYMVSLALHLIILLYPVVCHIAMTQVLIPHSSSHNLFPIPN